MWRAWHGNVENAVMEAEKGRRVHAATVRESADLIEVLYGLCNGESSGISVLSVACVSHELHTRKIFDESYILTLLPRTAYIYARAPPNLTAYCIFICTRLALPSTYRRGSLRAEIAAAATHAAV